MIYLDSCIVIYWVEGSSEFQMPVVAALRQQPSAIFCYSELVRLECLVAPIRAGDRVRQAVYETKFANLEHLPLAREVFDLAATLRASHRLKTPDALHAACAIVHECRELWTNDHRLAVLTDLIPTRVLP